MAITQTMFEAADRINQNQSRAAINEFASTVNSIQSAPQSARQEAPARRDDPGGTTADDLRGAIDYAQSHPGSAAHEIWFGYTVSTTDKEIVIDAGDGNDNVTVERMPDGRVRVNVNGAVTSYYIDPGDGRTVVIRGGTGDDTIVVDGHVNRDLTLDGGAGADNITGGAGNDNVYGGEGNDTLMGGSGNDYVVAGSGDDTVDGGNGYDVLYGLGGNDNIFGGDGRDYVDGGAGNDVVRGGEGNDVVSGGRDEDIVTGDGGDDVLVGAGGHDFVRDDIGANVVYAEAGDVVNVNAESRHIVVATPAGNLGHSIAIDGDEEFRQRIQSDLDTMAYIPVGQTLLSNLDASGRTTTIYEGAENKASRPVGTGQYGYGANVEVYIDPEFRNIDPTGDAQNWQATPPAVSLFHELAHAEDIVYGRIPDGVSEDRPGIFKPNSELSATGLDYDQNNDYRNDTNHRDTTENNFRDALGWDRREYYSAPEPPQKGRKYV